MLDAEILLVILLPLFWLILFVAYRIEQIALHRVLWGGIVITYFVLVLSAAFFPIPIDPDFISSRRSVVELPGYNFVPFHSMLEFYHREYWPIFLRQVGGNILLLLPIGLLLPFRSPQNDHFIRVLIAGLAVSLSIESLQLLLSAWYGFAYKVADIDDVILNSVGCVLGFFCYRAAKRFAKSPPPLKIVNLKPSRCK